MTTIDWSTALQGVTPQQGFQPLPPAVYRFRIVSGEGKVAGSGSIMVSCQFEVISGPKAGRKVFHNWNLPKDGSDKAKQSMGYFLGAMLVFGLTPEWFGQSFGGQQISKDHADFVAKTLVATGMSFKATASLQRDDPSRNNFNNFIADDGVEPEPPKEPTQSNFTPGAPAGPGGPPGLPLGGFPGSGGVGGAPIAAAPDWSNQPPTPPIQGNQFAPAAAAAPQPGGFPGQSFPGQVNPAQFPAPGQQAPAVAIPGQYQPPAAAQAPGMQQFGTTQADQQYGGAPGLAPVVPYDFSQHQQGQQAPAPAQYAQAPAPGQAAGVQPPTPQQPGGFPGGQAAPQMPGMPQPGQAPAPGQYPGQPGQPTY
jgi:hypothetical protein